MEYHRLFILRERLLSRERDCKGLLGTARNCKGLQGTARDCKVLTETLKTTPDSELAKRCKHHQMEV